MTPIARFIADANPPQGHSYSGLPSELWQMQIAVTDSGVMQTWHEVFWHLRLRCW